MKYTIRYRTPQGLAIVSRDHPTGPWHVTLPAGSQVEVDNCSRDKVLAMVDELCSKECSSVTATADKRRDAKHRNQPGLFA
jgi:hypothetical protein